jgi:hypothetical protein
MTNPTGKGGFQRGQSGNPGGRPKLPADIREAFKAKAPAALEVLTRCLQSVPAGGFKSRETVLLAICSPVERGSHEIFERRDIAVRRFGRHSRLLRIREPGRLWGEIGRSNARREQVAECLA